MDKIDVEVLMEQIWFFNRQFHESENQENLIDFHELMRESKNCCQLMLLKFASPDLVWIKCDLSQPNQEWSIGLHGLPETSACHIPMHVLQQGLSETLLNNWHIR